MQGIVAFLQNISSLENWVPSQTDNWGPMSLDFSVADSTDAIKYSKY